MFAWLAVALMDGRLVYGNELTRGLIPHTSFATPPASIFCFRFLGGVGSRPMTANHLDREVTLECGAEGR